MASASVVWHLDQQALQAERQQVAAVAAGRASAIQNTVSHALSVAYSVAAVVRQGNGGIEDFAGLGQELLTSHTGLAGLSLSPGGVISNVFPLAGNERSLGFDQLNDPVQGPEAAHAKASGKLTVAGPLNLVQGGMALVGRLPVYLDDGTSEPAFWGFVNATVRFPQVLEVVRLEQLHQAGLAYTLTRKMPADGTTQVIASSATQALEMPVEHAVVVPNGVWTLSIAPINGWRSTSYLAVKLAVGLAFSLMLAYATGLFLRIKTHEAGLEALIAKRTGEIAASQSKLQATLDAIPDLMLEIGLDGTYHDYHVPRDETMRPPVGFLDGKKVSDALPPEAARTVMNALQDALLNGRSDGHEFSLGLRKNIFWFEISVARKLGDDAEDPRFIVLARNITQRKRAESELRVAATAFNSMEGLAITDASKRILRVNPAFTKITGYDLDEAKGKSLHFLNSGRHEAAFYNQMWSSVDQTGAWQGEIWNRRKNGDVYPDLRTVTAVRGDDGAVSHYVNTFTDITERKATEEEINKLAFYDPLTGLPNRRLLLDRLRQGLAVSTRSGRIGALQFIDLDNFKTLNDTMGHGVGDLLLQQVARRLLECMRQGDTVARLGGDEFVVLIEELSEHREEAAAQAEVVGEKLLKAINQPYRLSGNDVHITPSIGITLYGGHQESTDELLKHADLAMYQAKAAGRNTLRFFDPAMQAVVSARVALESDIRHGILKNQFILYYQPQVDPQGNTVGAEVLLRWPHPQRGMVSPVEFIPLAEDTGLILPLGNWVMEAACAQLASWAADDAMKHLTLSVNVSARQFRQQDFALYVLDLLTYTGANPLRLKLELTESLLVNDVQDTIAKMVLLREHGVGFSLDDFGTGYSSLSYLKLLPLEQLKIDQSFVRDLLTDPNDAAIARTVVGLGHSLGLAVIAEGVETQEQRDFLADQGCDGYQGYLFGRPVPLAEFEACLTSPAMA